MTIFNEKFATIEYDADKKLLIQTWKGFSTSENFRKVIDTTVEFSKKNKFTGLISDTSKGAVVKKEDTDYAASVMPVLIGNGLKKMAFIMPESAFAGMSIKNFESKTIEEVEAEKNELVQYFAQLNIAIDWVKS